MFDSSVLLLALSQYLIPKRNNDTPINSFRTSRRQIILINCVSSKKNWLHIYLYKSYLISLKKQHRFFVFKHKLQDQFY
jgi:hypothetical protein